MTVLTHKCVTATTPTTENELELLAFSCCKVCLSQYDQIRLPHSLTTSYTK